MVAQTWLEAASYPKADDAQAAVRDLQSLGLSQQDISVLYTDTGHNVKAGILDGALWGAYLGVCSASSSRLLVSSLRRGRL